MPKIKLNIQKINIYFCIITTIATIAALVLISLFLYKNFYQTITQSEEVLILRQKVASVTVNMGKFNKIIKIVKEKNMIRDLGPINNPFSYGAQIKRIPIVKDGIENKVNGQNNDPAIPQFQ